MKIEAGELERLILSGRDLAAELDRLGRPVSGAMVNVLCDIALDRERAEVGPSPETADLIARAVDAVQPPKPAEEKHRHVWGGLIGDICVAAEGCTAKPRKKKEAPAAEGGGSQS